MGRSLFAVLILLSCSGGAFAADRAGDAVVTVGRGSSSSDELRDFIGLAERGRKFVVVLDDEAAAPPVLLGSPMQHPEWDRHATVDYPNGDMSMLWGNLDDAWTEREWGRFYVVAKWLAHHGFRTIVNPVAYERDLREAVTSPTTAGILWSSHGDPDGKIYDAAFHTMADDVFSANAGASFRHLTLSNCYGDATASYYSFDPRTAHHQWKGKTTTTEFFRYLEMGDWRRDLEKDLGVTFED